MSAFRSAANAPYGQPATANSQRQWRYGYGGSGPLPTHPLAYLFNGGYTGTIYDGTLSSFFTDSAKTTPCVTSGVDPVGGIGNLFGADLLQTSSPNKPVYIENNGIKGFRAGNISGMSRKLSASLASPASGYIQAFVYIRRGAVNVLSASRGGWAFVFDGYGVSSWYDSGLQLQQGSAGASVGMVMIATDVPPNSSGFWIYTKPFSVGDGYFAGGQANIPSDILPPNWTIGDGDLTASGGSASYDPVDVFFAFHINAPRGHPDNIPEVLRAYVAATFGALVP